MGRRPRLTSKQRSIAIGMLHGRMQSKAVAEHFGVVAWTISRLKVFFTKFDGFRTDQGQGAYENVSCWWPLCDSYCCQAEIVSCQPLNLRSSFMLRQVFMFQLTHFGIGFRNVTYRAGVPTIMLTAKHARARLTWVTAHHRWIINEWNSVIHR